MKGLFLRNRQFIIYCVVGASGVILDFSIYSLLVKFVSLNYQVANAVGYAFGTLFSFVLNAQFNFKTRDWLLLRLASFCAVALVGYTVSAGTLYVLVSSMGIDKYLSKALTLIVVVVLQYNLNRLISFRKSAKN